MCLVAPVCFNIRALYGRMRLMSVPRHFDHLDSCLMFSRSVGAVIGSSTPSLLAWRRKSICYYSITDLRNMAFISILDNFSLNHPHWMSHSESKCQAFLYKAALCSPQSRIRPLFSPLFLLSPTVATYHRFCPRPTLGSSDCSSPPSFSFPCSLSLLLWPSSHHRFVLRSTLGSSDYSSPPSFSFPHLLSPALVIIASILSPSNIGF